MENVKVENRTEGVSAKKLRRSGWIPCTVYGGQLEKDIPIQMTQKAAELLFRTKRVGSTVTLELGDQKIPALIKDKTHSNLGAQIEHVAFEALKADVPVHSVAHIFLENADQVPGMLEQLIHEVEFTALPKDMIDAVSIDVKGMPIGTTLTLADVPAFRNEAVTLKAASDEVVLKIVEKHLSEEEEEATAAAEG